MMQRELLIRADASPTMGTGHVMRMIALAQAWMDRGGNVTFVCCQCSDAIGARLASENIKLNLLGNVSPGSNNDCSQTAEIANHLGCKWVVLDGYVFLTNYQKQLRGEGLRVFAVDDYGHCDEWAADAVLNQNIYAPELDYRTENDFCQFLMGTEFVLFRREFVEADLSKNTHYDRIQKLLITLGGGDPDNATERILEILGHIAVPLEIKVIVGNANPNFNSLSSFVARSSHNIQLVSDVKDMPSLYIWADGVISAGGSTCWEWLLFNCRGAVVTITENQKPVAEALATRNLAINLGWHTELSKSNTLPLLEAFLSPIAQEHVQTEIDKFGAARVAAVMDGDLWIRPATDCDCRSYFDWVNDSDVRVNSINSFPITWEEHYRWFNSKIASVDCRMMVGIIGDKPIGQIRFDKTRNQTWEVDFSIASSNRGRGLGHDLLRLGIWAMKKFSELPISATVKSGNSRSRRCFERQGFKKVAQDQKANNKCIDRFLLRSPCVT